MNPNNASRRTFQKVHRDSRLAGVAELESWRANARLFAGAGEDARDRALEAARLYELEYKAKGRRNGPLGHVGLEVLKALWHVVDFSSGRLEPSIQWIMEATGRCRDAVITALKRLSKCGFVTWVRRFTYTGLRGFRTPEVQQATNAYALAIPPVAAMLLTPRLVLRTLPRGWAAWDEAAQRNAFFASRAAALHAAADPYRNHHYREEGPTPLSRVLARLESAVLKRRHTRESVTPDQTRVEVSKREPSP